MNRKRAISLVTPHLGGTYSLFKAMRKGLRSYRWDLYCAYLDPKLLPGPPVRFAEGYKIGCRGLTDPEAAQRLANHVLKFDLLIVNVLTNPLSTNIVRYIPSTFPRLMVVHSISPGTYIVAKALKPWVHKTIAVSPRIKENLVRFYGFKKSQIATVLSGALFENSQNKRRKSQNNPPLKVISLGRLEDYSKGILSLPKIWSRLRGNRFRLDIYGTGPDKNRLRLAIAQDKRIKLKGPVPFGKTLKVFSKYDAFIFPSHFEGFGLALVEALAAGCVPIARRIRGVTDKIIRPKRDGLLFETTDQAAKHLVFLADNPKRLLSFSKASVLRSSFFNFKTYGQRLAPELQRCLSAKPTASPFPWEQWEYPREMKNSFRSLLPKWIKHKGYRFFEFSKMFLK